MSKHTNKRILLVVRGHIGDLIEMLPTVRSVRQHYPDAHITLFGNSYSTSLLEGCPYLDSVVSGFSFDNKSKIKKTLILSKYLLKIIFGRYDTVLFLTEFPWGLLVAAWLGGIKTRVGYSGSTNLNLGWAANLLTHNLGFMPDDRTCRVTPGKVASALGVSVDLHYSPIDWFPRSLMQRSQHILKNAIENALGKDQPVQPYFVFHPGCHWMCNEWEDDRWAELADRAIETFECPVLFTGSADEIPKIDGIMAQMRNKAVSLAGITTIPDFINIVAGARLLAAIDGSQTQIALANQVPAVILFGTDNPTISGALFKDEKFVALRSWQGPDFPGNRDPHCALANGHCHNQACQAEHALGGITVDEVLQAMADQLYPVRGPVLNLANTIARQ